MDKHSTEFIIIFYRSITKILGKLSNYEIAMVRQENVDVEIGGKIKIFNYKKARVRSLNCRAKI